MTAIVPAVSAPAQSPTIRLHNRALPVLIAASAAAVLGTGFLSLAPNRLLSGRPVALWAATNAGLVALITLCAAVMLAIAFRLPRPAIYRAAALVAAVLVLAVLFAAGQGAAELATTAPPRARVSLGAGFWVLFGAAGLMLIDALQRADTGLAARLGTAAAFALAFLLMAKTGLFDALSLAKEYETRRDFFTSALVRHIVLVAAAVGPAVAIGFPLGVLAARRPQIRGPVFAILNLLQTIPSVALFGLLIVPLSALATALPLLAAIGVGGIGPAPAIIALILYALLPVVRNSMAGIDGVDPGVIDAGRGMGMTPRQLFWRAELPLAAPVLLAGLRIVIVQAIGLAVVAALIGAGGLGTLVFEGLGQYAADLVLLGALPAITLALAADFLLQTLSALLARRFGR
ncbi:MAG TPA: ABC transporter permease [Stellaceae bacterium]